MKLSLVLLYTIHQVQDMEQQMKTTRFVTFSTQSLALRVTKRLTRNATGDGGWVKQDNRHEKGVV